jgi:hypothetical protein
MLNTSTDSTTAKPVSPGILAHWKSDFLASIAVAVAFTLPVRGFLMHGQLPQMPIWQVTPV